MEPAASDATLFLGETAGFWVQTAVVLLGAVAAIVTIVVNGVLSRKTIAHNGELNRQTNDHNEKIARQRATIDLLLTQRMDQGLSESKKSVGAIHNNGGDFVSLASSEKEKDEHRVHLLTIINNYEYIALGIREGALDDSIYKRAVYSQVLRDWKAMQPFILELRRQKKIETLFQEFEFLAKRWLKSPLHCDAQS